MDLIGEFHLHDDDNCNERYCLAFHELRQLKGKLFFSLRVAVPSPPQGETAARERLRKPDSNRIPLPPFHLGGRRGGEGTATRRLLILYRLGLGERARKILGDRKVIRENEGRGECQSSLKESKGGL